MPETGVPETGPPVEPAPAGLTELLAHGPFHEALAAAVAHRGLTLARLRHHLAVRGCEVSVPTLSCWCRGVRRPERPESLRALVELEQILELPDSALSDLLGAPRKRGRAVSRPLSDSTLWQAPRSLPDTLRELDLAHPTLRAVSVHSRQVVDERGVERSLRHLRVMESTRHGVDRMRVVVAHLAGSAGHTRVRALSGVSEGRQRTTGDGFLVAELHLDTELAKGEQTVVEHIADLDPAGERSTECSELFHRPFKQCVVEVFFDSRALPGRAFAFRRRSDKPEQRSEVRLSRAGVLRAAWFDQPAGEYGLTWDWPEVPQG